MSDQTVEIEAQESEVASAFDAGVRSTETKELSPGVFLTSRETKVEDLRKWKAEHRKLTEDAPVNRQERIKIHTKESFVDAVNKYGTPNAVTYADSRENKITAIFDHDGFHNFKAEIAFLLSAKLKKWSRMTDYMSQVEFAEFLDDNLEDIYSGENGEYPTASQIQEMATGIQVTENTETTGKINLSNGAANISYVGEVQSSVEIPTHIQIAIPLFENGDKYTLQMRLRYRSTGGGIKFKLLFTNLDRSLEEHFEEILQFILEKTDVTAFRGSCDNPY